MDTADFSTIGAEAGNGLLVQILVQSEWFTLTSWEVLPSNALLCSSLREWDGETVPIRSVVAMDQIAMARLIPADS